MTKFIAVKIHYDHRKDLKSYAKYSRVVTKRENDSYLKLYESGVGGQGFHECLNFRIPPGQGRVRAYLPPTCIPKESAGDLVIFSFTYKGDEERPSEVVGVHAGCRFLGRDGLPRPDYENVSGVEPFWYHVEADPELTTLFTARLPYSPEDGIFTPQFEKWGYGLRNIHASHAQSIIESALAGLDRAEVAKSAAERYARHREKAVLNAILGRYFTRRSPKQVPSVSYSAPPIPDSEIGFLGEKYIFDREVGYVTKLGLDSSLVEWVSQAAPTAPFDIKTVRVCPSGSGYRDHFLEVKSMRSSKTGCIYVSSGQIEFAKAHEAATAFVVVSFDSATPKVSDELSYMQLFELFNLEPIKFRAVRKTSTWEEQ